MEAGVSEIGAPAELLFSPSGIVAAPSVQPEVREASAATAGAPALEAWLGRVCVCWLCACLPLVLGGSRVLAVVELALPMAAAWLVAAAVAEGSSRERRPAYGTVPWATWLALLGVGLVSGMSWWVPSLAGARTEVAASAFVFAAGAAAWELLVRRAAAGSRRVVVVGSTRGAAALVDAIAEVRTPYAVVGVVDDGVGDSAVVAAPTLGTLDELAAVLARTRPDVVVLPATSSAHNIVATIAAHMTKEISVVGIAEFYEHAFGRLPLRHLSPSWFTAAFHLYRRPYNRITKRAFDLAIASTALVVSAPLLLLIALLVRQTRGPVIYRQVREGEGGRPFTIYKFRTMVADAEADGLAVWAGERDERITRTGRLLRRLRLDELPQLWNVLEGTMSIVGPRPERPEHSAVLAEAVPFWSRRTLLKPGITGWAQINDGYAFDAVGAERKLAYDLWYLRHRSLLVDAAICMRTLGRLTFGAR